ncbi:pre-peptidase C-terminal domain-containing protein [Aliikangiella maris]|uniref:Pre-peptidase C-terminal domain-containing protein n=2 Tax=Aliikangiella maris TaxID=3162458 RepID=A0ABV3MN50_9GAMM
MYKIITATIMLFTVGSAQAILPDNLTVNIGDVTNDGKRDRLILKKRSVRAANFRLQVWEQNSYQEITPPEVRTYRGYVESDPSLTVTANIEPGNKLNAIFSDGRHSNVDIEINNKKINVSGDSGTAEPGTGNQVISRSVDRTSPTNSGYIIPKYTMRRIRLGAEIQYSIYNHFKSIDKALARIEQRINDNDFFYARDMGIAWELGEVVIRKDDFTGNYMTEWKNKVNQNNQNNLNLVYQFKKSGGGSAGGRIFQANNANHVVFGNIGSLKIQSASLGHEAAHQFGAGHKSSWGDTMTSAESAIGTSTVQRMIDHSHVAHEAAAPAIIYGAKLPPHAMEDFANTNQDQSVDINLLENDYDGNGDSISIARIDNSSEKGGVITNLGNGNVRYTPPSGYLGMDTFKYHVKDNSGLTNRHGSVKVYVRNNGLASHFKLDETSGSIAYDSGVYQADCQLEKGIRFSNSTSGAIGRALRNNKTKTNARVSCAGVGDPLDGSLSASLWVKYDQVPSDRGVLISKGGAVISNRVETPRGGWSISHLKNGAGWTFNGNLQRDRIDNSTEMFDRTSKNNIQANTWYHLVMVMDRSSGKVRAWVNNQEVSNSKNGSNIADGLIENYYPLRLFNAADDDASSPSILDDVRIYNKALTAADVNALYNKQEIPGDNTPAPIPTDGQLENGKAIDIATPADGSNLEFYIDVPANAADLKFTMSGGQNTSGDADIMVAHDRKPTPNNNDCRPYKSGNNEECVFNEPQSGRWHVVVENYNTYKNVSLVASYQSAGTNTSGDFDACNGASATTNSGELKNNQAVCVGAASNTSSFYTYVEKGTSSVKIELAGGTGNADIYALTGTWPTDSIYDASSIQSGNNESMTISNPPEGWLYITVVSNPNHGDTSLRVSHH